MRPVRLLTLHLFLTILAAPLLAQGCAATPEAAAQSALGVVRVSSSAGAGFRVQDVQVDPVLHRVWVRVRRCDNASAPAVLVPLQAPVNSPVAAPQLGNAPQASPTLVAGLQTLSSAPTTSSAASAISSAPAATFLAAAAPVMIVHAGDPVHVVFASSEIHMELEATANQQGAIGDTIQVTLKRRPTQAADEPEHRMRGTVRADHSIEVQP
jgi:hypothetical protein